MRRMLFAWAIFGLAAAAPLLARGDDKDIARQIVVKLNQEKAAGRLQGFNIDLKVDSGVVWLKGRVASPQQAEMVLETARLTPGVSRVMKNIEIGAGDVEAPASSRNTQVATIPAAPAAPSPPATAAPQAMQPASVAEAPRQSSRRNPQEESALQLLTGPATPQAISLAPPPSIAEKPAPLQVQTVAATRPVPENHDQEIAKEVGVKLKRSAAIGQLDGHNLAFKVESGVVWLRGSVVSANQEEMVLAIARSTPGVVKIMKHIDVLPVQPAVAAAESEAAPAYGETVQAAATQPAQNSVLARPAAPQATAPAAAPATPASPVGLQKTGPVQPQLAPVNPYYGYGYPYAGYYPAPSQTPVAFAPAQTASAEFADATNAAGMAGPPPGMAPYAGGVPATPVGAFGGAGVRYDHPNMPAYSWPSYAAYPNYAAVTYPKQYSPTVWPYIGPFYPYPQVPLGWRKVTLEWDDGWWQLDFKDQSRPWKTR